MPWVKLTDRIHDNEKIAAVSHDAFRLWVLSISYANLKLTDGHIPAARAKLLVSLRAPEKTIQELVDAKLWHRASAPCASCVRQRADVKADPIPSGGYVIHHYFGDPETHETYQKTRWTVEAERARLRAAGRQGGLRSGEMRSSQVNLSASAGGEAEEAHRSSPGSSPGSSSQVKPTGQPPSSSHHAWNGKLAGQARTPSPVTPSSGAIAPVPRGRAPEPEIPDGPEPPGTARSGSPGRREGLRQVGATATRIVGTARGAR